MGAIETRIFRNGDSMAVDLPTDLDFPEGTIVRIEKVDGEVRIKAIEALDPTEEKRRLLQMIDRIDAAWRDVPPHPDRGHRAGIEFPDRRGLY